VKLTKIEISNFRCLVDFILDIDGQSIFLVGVNASGKSSLLNAIVKGLGQDRAFAFEDFHDPKGLCFRSQVRFTSRPNSVSIRAAVSNSGSDGTFGRDR
jgi:predicted ATP-dependent endonuclease of OLD family